MNYYKTVQFKFSESSWTWLQTFFEPIVSDYQLHAPDTSALVHFNDVDLQTLIQSSAWSEIVTFLQTHSLTDLYPQLFIYKRLPKPREIVLGNPHIDTTGAGSIAIDVPTRFNILIQGDENTEMIWWNHNRSSSAVVESTFVRPDRKTVSRLQAAGRTLKEKWDSAGEPVARCNTLAKKQEHASFVRTDVLHLSLIHI
jgi:hypothetical protein